MLDAEPLYEGELPAQYALGLALVEELEVLLEQECKVIYLNPCAEEVRLRGERIDALLQLLSS